MLKNSSCSAALVAIATIVVARPLTAELAAPVVAVDTSHSPHAVLRSVGIDEVTWTQGFMAERYAACRDRGVPAMWQIMRGTQYKPFLQHFLIAAGRQSGEYHGAAWNDGDFYKWIEAATALEAQQTNSDRKSALRESIEAVIAAQRDDGYLHTPVLIAQRNGDASARPFRDRNDFEVYNMGHLLTTACVQYRATGDRELLEAAERAAGFLEAAFANPSPDLARNAVCPSHYMGIVELYRTTNKQKYLRLALHLAGMRSAVVDGGDDNQDRLPFAQQREAVGHAVRANYLYAGMADLYLETGDAATKQTLDAVWDSVTRKKLYITGACGALYDGASPDGSEEQATITRIHQAYGRNYQLPSTTAHNETCAAIGAMLWNWRMFAATGESKYVDWFELAYYNAVLSGVSLEGTKYFYVNPLRVTDPLPTQLRWSREREPFIVSYCCPPNVLRTIAESGGYAYALDDNSVWVNLYGSSTLRTRMDDADFKVTQVSDYPWQGSVRLTIDACPADRFAIRLRVPNWCAEARVAVNDQAIESVTVSSGYALLERQWQPGDKVVLEMPMPVRLVESHPLVEETRNQFAVQRGPIVYCLESIDLPMDIKLQDVCVPIEADLAAEFDPKLLGGVNVLKGTLTHRADRGWDSLYRDASTQSSGRFHATLIPYFAWGNRGPGEMTVWLPRD